MALPAAWIVIGLAGGQPWRWGIRPTGDMSAKLIVLALAISPLRALLPRVRAIAWLEAQRRIIGLAAFGYAALHVAVFVLSIGRLDWIIQGMAFASMWTGWIAFALLASVAAISNAAAHHRLGVWWKRLQRLVYPAAILTLVHWLLLSTSPTEALAHALPLIGLRLAAFFAPANTLRQPPRLP